MARMNKTRPNNIEALYIILRYLDDMQGFIFDDFNFYTYYTAELSQKEANIESKGCPCLDRSIHIKSGKFNGKMYNKMDEFSVPIVHYPILDGEVPLSSSYGFYIS